MAKTTILEWRIRLFVVALCSTFLLIDYFANDNYDMERTIYRENAVKHVIYSFCKRVMMVSLLINTILIVGDYINKLLGK
jgi:hypothetical protein